MNPIFQSNPDYFKTAILNWRLKNGLDIDNMMALAEGFLSSAIELMKICKKDNSDHKTDMLIFPALTNANHGIELYLKSIIWILNRLLNSEEQFKHNHDLLELLNTTLAKIKSYENEESLNQFNNQAQELTNYITELYKKIKSDDGTYNTDFSRYPITNKSVNQFYIESKDYVEIDILNFIEVFENIKNILDDRVSHYYFTLTNAY